jgi:hypothetical protein
MKGRKGFIMGFFQGKWTILSLVLGLLSAEMPAQTTLSLSAPKNQVDRPTFTASVRSQSIFSSPYFSLSTAAFRAPSPKPPLQAARIDPDPGYLSFLCRKELWLEEKLPIGIWFRIGESNPLLKRQPQTGAVSYFQFKLLKF